MNYPPKIIITSAFKEHVLEAIELGVIDYLMNPISNQRFLAGVSKSLDITIPQNTFTEDTKSTSKQGIFYLKVKDYFIRVDEDEFLYQPGDRNYCKINLKNNQYTLAGNLSHYLSKLTREKGILGINNSYAVALNKITRYNSPQMIYQL